jgi:phosphotransacetylase
MIRSFDELLRSAQQLPRKRIATVFPASAEIFAAVAEAARSLPTEHRLIGPRATIEEALGRTGLAPGSVTIIEAQTQEEAVDAALEMAHRGELDILMKGTVDTGTFMRGVLDRERGLRSGGLLSDVFLFEYPARRERPFMMITDGGVTVAPGLKEKVQLIRNAVAVAHALGNELPNVALLSATELVTASIPSTVEAREIVTLASRGEITGCVVAEPLALDNAVSEEAASEKGITSPVAGKADILIMPSIEAANALAKSTTYFAGFRLAHVIVGAQIPLLIPSRADKSDARLLSIALGMLMSEHTGSA